MSDPEPQRPKRRPRYRGTHPRHFHEKYKEHNPERYAEDVAKILASGKTPAGTHRSIMVREILEVLAPQPGDLAVDATLGYGGHALELLRAISRAGDSSVWTWTRSSFRRPRPDYGPVASPPTRSSCDAATSPACRGYSRRKASCRRYRAGRPRPVFDANRRSVPWLHFQAAWAAGFAHEPSARPAGLGVAGLVGCLADGAPLRGERGRAAR